jgi:predicted lysophospholipase L1 biosynthesis ABC-type transport system permease subunit
MYGAGHGEFEAFYLLTVSTISYISMAIMLNNGMSGTMTACVTDVMSQKMLEATFAFLTNTSPASFLVVSVGSYIACGHRCGRRYHGKKRFKCLGHRSRSLRNYNLLHHNCLYRVEKIGV